MVRVLFLNDTSRNGGPGRSLLSILRFVDPKLVRRSVVVPRRGVVSELLEQWDAADEIVVEPDMVENPIEPWGRPMVRGDFDAAWPLQAGRMAGNVLRTAAAMARLRRLVRVGRYDVIYCNGTNADFGGAALALATGVPALWHVRYTSVPRAVVPLHRWLSGRPAVRRILCVSEAAAAQFPTCRAKVHVLHNALDVDEFDPARVRGVLRQELGLPSDAFVFGSHGRVLRRKGFVELLHAARRLLDGMTAEHARRTFFVVVGDTPEDFRPDHVGECRKLAASLGIADRARFLGFRKDVRPYVVDFDVAVVPSVYADPLPRSVIESMALGKAVIAFDMGGIREMVRDGETGALVRGAPPDTDALAEAMARYFREDGMRRAHGENARRYAQGKFDARAHAKAVQGHIFDVVGHA
jgi:glycosyltransferase involved in cell wall biosynthesis